MFFLVLLLSHIGFLKKHYSLCSQCCQRKPLSCLNRISLTSNVLSTGNNKLSPFWGKIWAPSKFSWCQCVGTDCKTALRLFPTTRSALLTSLVYICHMCKYISIYVIQISNVSKADLACLKIFQIFHPEMKTARTKIMSNLQNKQVFFFSPLTPHSQPE